MRRVQRATISAARSATRTWLCRNPAWLRLAGPTRFSRARWHSRAAVGWAMAFGRRRGVDHHALMVARRAPRSWAPPTGFLDQGDPLLLAQALAPMGQ
jgi:hypothetical protein